MRMQHCRKKTLLGSLSRLPSSVLMICATFLLAGGSPALAQILTNLPPTTANTDQGLRLSVQSEKERYEIGEEISVTLVVSNTTDRSIILPDRDHNFDNKFSVTNGKGNQVAFTKRGQILDGEPAAWQFYNSKVAPHGIEKYSIRIDDRFELNSTGTYFVTARRLLGTDASHLYPGLISNTAKFVIVPTGDNSQ
jgi:hypothetical protein